MANNNESSYKPGWQWLGRSLANYKSQHAQIAESKGIRKELDNAKSLTQARKVIYGIKRKNTK